MHIKEFKKSVNYIVGHETDWLSLIIGGLLVLLVNFLHYIECVYVFSLGVFVYVVGHSFGVEVSLFESMLAGVLIFLVSSFNVYISGRK